MIFSVFDYTCAMIPNDQIVYLEQVKDDPPRNPPTVFRVRVSALFEWQNRSKVAFSFVFALNAFAFALCINGPLVEVSMSNFLCVEAFYAVPNWHFLHKIKWLSRTVVSRCSPLSTQTVVFEL